MPRNWLDNGVRVNAISPVARTRLSEATPSARRARPAAGAGAEDFDPWHPGNVSPLVAYLATEECQFTGNMFCVHGGLIGQYQGWSIHRELTIHSRSTVANLAVAGTVPRTKSTYPRAVISLATANGRCGSPDR